MNAPSETFSKSQNQFGANLEKPPDYWLVECKHCGCSVRYDDFAKMVWAESAADTRHGGSGCRRVAQVTKAAAEVLF